MTTAVCGRMAWLPAVAIRVESGQIPPSPRAALFLLATSDSPAKMVESGFANERRCAMAVSTRTRFEVLKRDSFTCQYCGRSRDEDSVKLHVDHVIPRKEGGSDDIENLVTACQDCNLGKSAKPLTSRAPVPDVDEQIAAMRERRAKLAQYEAEKNAVRLAREQRFTEVWNYWFNTWGETKLAKCYIPWENVLRGYTEKLGVAEVKEAMDITGARFQWIKVDAVKYFNGICKRKVADLEGRVVFCTHCEDRIILTREQAEETADRDHWIHGECRKRRDAAVEEAAAVEDSRRCYACLSDLAEGDAMFCAACEARTMSVAAVEAKYREDASVHYEDDIGDEVRAMDRLIDAAGL